jgi:hypothetical protein
MNVRSLHELVLADVKRQAVIMDFLPVFAVRKVKEILRRRGPAGQEDYPQKEPSLPLWTGSTG